MKYIHSFHDAVIAGITLFLAFCIGLGLMAAFDAMNAIKLEPVPEPSPLILTKLVYVPRPEIVTVADRICSGHNGYAGVMFWKYVPTQYEVFCNDRSLWGSDGVQIYAAEKATAVKP